MTQRILYLPGLDGGGGGASAIAEHLPPELSFEVFSYPTGRVLDFEELTRLVALRLEALDGLLLGESFGGAVAQETAIRRPEAVKRLVLLSTFNHEVEALAAALARTAIRILPRPLLRPVTRWLGSWKLAGTLRGEKRREFLDYLADADHKEFGRRLELLKGFDTRPRLREIRCPVTVLHAAKDPIASAPSQLEPWRRMADSTLHSIAGAGHLVSVERSEEIAALLTGR